MKATEQPLWGIAFRQTARGAVVPLGVFFFDRGGSRVACRGHRIAAFSTRREAREALVTHGLAKGGRISHLYPRARVVRMRLEYSS